MTNHQARKSFLLLKSLLNQGMFSFVTNALCRQNLSTISLSLYDIQHWVSLTDLKTNERLPAGFVSNPIAQTPLTSRKERREPMGAYGMRNSLESEFRKTFGSHRSLYSRNNHNNISNIQNNNNNNNNNSNNNNNNSDDEDNCNNNNNRHLINISYNFRFHFCTGSGQNLSVD